MATHVPSILANADLEDLDAQDGDVEQYAKKYAVKDDYVDDFDCVAAAAGIAMGGGVAAAGGEPAGPAPPTSQCSQALSDSLSLAAQRHGLRDGHLGDELERARGFGRSRAGDYGSQPDLRPQQRLERPTD